jgi:hypothetical protein
MAQDYYQALAQSLNAGYNPYLPDYGQTQPAELYELSQPQQQQQQSIPNISSFMDMFGGAGGGAVTPAVAEYGGFSSGVASSPAAGGGTWYGPFAEGGIASGGGGAAGGGAGASSGGSMLSTLGPWAALAAIIYANETEARRGGYRSEDDTQYAKDLLGGKVLSQDVEQRWAPKLESAWGGSGSMASAASNIGSLDFSNAWGDLKQHWKDDPIIGALSGLF